MEKWIKLRMSQNGQKVDYSVQLSACIFRFDDGQIERVYVNGTPCIEIVDGSGHTHSIDSWNCESLEEFELQAMLNNCIFGLSEAEEGAVKAALDGLLVKQLKKAKEKICELLNDNDKLKRDVDRKRECLHEIEDDAYNLFMSYWENSDWEDSETMCSLMSDFADMIGFDGPKMIDDWQQISRKKQRARLGGIFK